MVIFATTETPPMDTPSSKKRKANENAVELGESTPKAKKQWKASRQDFKSKDSSSREIEPGVSGIWATCAMGKEAPTYAKKLYPANGSSTEEPAHSEKPNESTETDIEAEIQNELSEMRSARKENLFTSIKLDTQCLTFFRTRPPVEPVSFVQAICRDAASSTQRKRSRFVKRLTPITLTGKATEDGLGEVAKQVLAPHFHGPNATAKKFAIRPNLRNHKVLKRDAVIKQVAAAVGPLHSVDLHDYDLLILVEIYKNICGMSVVGSEFESLKRFNLAELYGVKPDTAQEKADIG
ncbi:hypothetical protein NA57DRAFT_58684 [Rhizodiscina lignyota]|uniref:THUMP domain-containing protein n=1 Tax=Rhizodiscina lignyota TaxID=1504668 RepID=A0A9P4IDZ1_9PEZI|nr:hypothetical protein NA57DRAFT_58684 [Rhizodiscina lignyota]